MSTFSSLFQSGTAFYGDPFGPIIDTITDFGWSLLPQFPGSIRPGSSAGARPRPETSVGTVKTPVPVADRSEPWVIEAEAPYIPPILARPSGAWEPEVRRETVIVDTVRTEVEVHPEGDFPAGSIFAPGRTWGGSVGHDLDAEYQEEQPVSLISDIFSGAVDIWQGQPVGGYANQPWMGMSAAGDPTGVTTRPSGRAALPPSAAPVQMMASGDGCGNRRYVTLDRQTGKITCKRRRRRRLLTNRDLADLASLKTITGGGAALNSAVIRAVR